MSQPCNLGDNFAAAQACSPPPAPTRRRLLQRAATGVAGLTCADFLGYFFQHGLPAAQILRAGHDRLHGNVESKFIRRELRLHLADQWFV